MIRKKHALTEVRRAEDIIFDKDKSIDEKVVALFRVLVATIKIVLSNRVNTVKLLEHHGIPLDEPESRKGRRDDGGGASERITSDQRPSETTPEDASGTVKKEVDDVVDIDKEQDVTN